MKKQQVETKEVCVSFHYWLSKTGQLAGKPDQILKSEQEASGRITVPVEALKKMALKKDGTIQPMYLKPQEEMTAYNAKSPFFYFDSLQTLEQLYNVWATRPAEYEIELLEKEWKKDAAELTNYLNGKNAYFLFGSVYYDDSKTNVADVINKKYFRILNPKKLADLVETVDAEFEKRKETARIKAETAKAETAKAEKEKAEAEKVAAEKTGLEKADRLAWIEKNGSERLKKMVDGGYEHRLTYEKERAGIELPGSIYNLNGDKIEFSTRANPSLTALKAEEKYKKIYGDENVWIGWGFEKMWSDDTGENVSYDPADGEDIPNTEFIWIHPNWSRQGFALFDF